MKFSVWPEGDHDHPALICVEGDEFDEETDDFHDRVTTLKSALRDAFAAIWDVREREIRFLVDVSSNDATMEGATVFNVWHDGDESVGIYGESVVASILVEDPGVALDPSGIKNALSEAFSSVWGGWRVHVATPADLDAMSGPR